MSPDTGNGWNEIWLAIKPSIPLAIIGGLANVIVHSHHIAKEKGIMKKSFAIFTEMVVGCFFAMWVSLLFPAVSAYLEQKGLPIPGELGVKIGICSFLGGTFGSKVYRWVTYKFFKFESRGKNDTP